MYCHCLDGRIQDRAHLEKDNYINRLHHTVLGWTNVRYSGMECVIFTNVGVFSENMHDEQSTVDV
jgi:hypothetical protein